MTTKGTSWPGRSADAAARRPAHLPSRDTLRRLAHLVMRRLPRSPSFDTADLMQEFYLRRCCGPSSGIHSDAAIRTALRNLAIDRVRARAAKKRRHPQAASVEFAPDLDASIPDVVHLRRILERLRRVHSRRADVAELKIFAGLTNAELAATLGLHRATVERDWRIARAWLSAALEQR